MRRLLLSLLLCSASLHAQQITDRMDMRGTVGPYRIGATMWIENQNVFITGHYFYDTRLTDIPLTATTQGGPTLVLSEPGGAAFHLHFTGNGSNKGAPLNFYNSVAFDGTWTQGNKSLPVHLGFTSSLPGSPKDRRYGDITSDSDTDFEARVQRFTQAVLSGDRKLINANISYPLHVNGRHRLVIPSEPSLIAHWDQIFTPSFIEELKLAVPHDMFVRNGMAMLGSNGLVWFDSKGATSINLP